ncbi:MAG: lipocalin family protein [Nevskia sp.]|nr:lipocalin family protein [Nevskia sp.]
MAEAPLALAPAVDLQRFMGRWYVIANIPYFGERGYVGSYVEYAQRPDGGIDDLFFGHKGGFDAPLDKKTLKDRVVAGTNNARWRASPFWPVSFPYLILYVDPDYQYALVGYPDKRWGWVFARSPDISDDVYQQLLMRFYTQGYDISRFERVPQTKTQVGRAGFQAP